MARESFFDELARGLADGTLTRGKALRLMGAALLGGTLASLGMGGEAAGDPPECKRNGKHCTSNNQCCSQNCSGVSCQAQTTTTSTSTTSTSTTTPTTSTSTSTTPTSTTTMCLPNGGTCSANNQCCSGRCAGGMCAEPCPAGTVLLCNGTCAKTCTSDADCTGCTFECAPEAASDPPRSLCSNPTDFAAPCTTDCDCPSGQFCREFTGVGGNFCLFAC